MANVRVIAETVKIENAQSELYFIHQKTEGAVKQPAIEELIEIAEVEGIPMR